MQKFPHFISNGSCPHFHSNAYYANNTGPYTLRLTGSSPPPPSTNVPTWTYSDSPNLRGLVVALQRHSIGTGYQYRFNVVSQEGFSSDIASAHLTIVAPRDYITKVRRTSISAQVIYLTGPSASQILQSLDAAPWVHINQAWNNYTVLAKSVLGFIPLVGNTMSLIQLIQDALSMTHLIGGVGPSFIFNSELNSDEYNVYGVNVAIGPFRAVRITVDVDPLGNSNPHFYLTIKQSGTTIVGVEILDRLEVPIIMSYP